MWYVNNINIIYYREVANIKVYSLLDNKIITSITHLNVNVLKTKAQLNDKRLRQNGQLSSIN